MRTNKINPQVIPAAIFKPLIISLLEVVPLKISLSARNPRKKECETRKLQNHCHSPELVISGEIIDEQV